MKLIPTGSIQHPASSMTYTKETLAKWENENGKTSHMKVSMVHNEEECEKECTATVPCIAFTFIPGMEICALKAPKDAVTLVSTGGGMISGRLDGERPSISGRDLDSTICLACHPGFSLQFSLTHLILQSAMCTQTQSTPATTCTRWEQRPRRSVQPPVFGNPSATSGRTTPMWADAGSRSQILGRGRRRRGQTLVRSLVVLQVGDIC